jgi:hypothetical protein
MLALERLPLEAGQYIIQQWHSTQPLVFKGWLGLQPSAFILIVTIVLIVLYVIGKFWWNDRQRKKNEKLAKNGVLCEFCGEGWSETVLCEVFKGQVKQQVKSTRATFGVQDFIAAPKDKIKHPANWDVDFYFWLPDHAFLVSWPDGKPSSQQIRIMKSHYYINDPMPKVTYRPQEWDADKYTRTTAILLKYAQDEKVAEVAVGELSGKFKMFETALKYVQRIPLMFILQLVTVFVILITAFMAWKGMSNSGNALKWLKGLGGS